MIISYDGTVSMDENLRVFSTCHMDVHKFPFDTQECNISISSANHCIDEMRIIPISNSTRATQFSHQVIKTQGEWEFLHLTVSTQNFSFEERKWEMLTYALRLIGFVRGMGYGRLSTPARCSWFWIWKLWIKMQSEDFRGEGLLLGLAVLFNAIAAPRNWLRASALPF
ncbi:5-hydroxytryptamine receptor 3C-like [Oryzias melastigma]|uniref:5-hydroxytryptamine receptor 3C-like n=1 Tax=Oryzias melastigma TaxID=30732 RepID=UPI00168D9056|nr:5-hydroxytryptamine receptor 3C-like [Oryzias melastigma]